MIPDALRAAAGRPSFGAAPSTVGPPAVPGPVAGPPAGVVAGPPGYTGVGPGPGHGQAVAAFVHQRNAARLADMLSHQLGRPATPDDLAAHQMGQQFALHQLRARGLSPLPVQGQPASVASTLADHLAPPVVIDAGGDFGQPTVPSF